MKKFALAIALLASAGLAQAEGFNQNNMYFGGGLGSNELDGWSENAIGYQFFGGYKLDNVKLGSLKSAVEVGYMNSGEWEEKVCVTFFTTVCATATAEASGLWANYVASYDFSPTAYGLGRIGLDFGDDDGMMFGIGGGFKATPKLDIRGEYVVRQNITSLQANVVYYLK